MPVPTSRSKTLLAIALVCVAAVLTRPEAPARAQEPSPASLAWPTPGPERAPSSADASVGAPAYPPRAASPPYALQNTNALALSLEFLGIAASLVVLSESAGGLASACRWCEPNLFDERVRDGLRMGDPKAAALASHIVSLGLTPALAPAGVIASAAAHRQGWHALQDSVIIINAFLLTTALADFAKKITDRELPAFH